MKTNSEDGNDKKWRKEIISENKNVVGNVENLFWKHNMTFVLRHNNS